MTRTLRFRHCRRRVAALLFVLGIGPGAALAAPGSTARQFSLVAAQIGAAGFVGEDNLGSCSADACRDTFPVIIRGDACVLNIRVGAPNALGQGDILFAIGPCRSTVPMFILSHHDSGHYALDRFGAAVQAFTLPLTSVPSEATGDVPSQVIDEAVLRPTVTVELRIISRLP